MIMDSGVFEPVNRTSTRFDGTSLKYYKLKSENAPKNDTISESDDKENLSTITRFVFIILTDSFY